MIRVLLVEDEEDAARRVTEPTLQQRDEIIFKRVASRSAAEEALQRDDAFDLLVCDLRVPATDGGIATSPQHGLAVHAAVARELPGTPVFFLTGVAEDNIDEIADATSAGMVSHAFGEDSPFGMVQLFRKHKVAACVQAICDYAEAISELERVDIMGEVDLSPIERRAIGIACRRWNGTAATVEPMLGGLTGAITHHVTVLGTGDVERASILLKIDRLAKTRDERARYREFVQGQIDRLFPEFIGIDEHFMGRHGCLVYKFADAWSSSLFEFVGDSGPLDAPQLISHIRQGMIPWSGIVETEERRIRDLREAQSSWESVCEGLADSGHPDVQGLLARMEGFEDRRVLVDMTPQHGDLHGENVLVSAEGVPTLIDCGDIAMRPAGTDAVTLELSFLFHPDSPWRERHWPPEDLARWHDGVTLAESSPMPELPRSCRQWAIDAPNGRNMQLAAYLYAARQLKYPDTPKDVVAWLLEGILQG